MDAVYPAGLEPEARAARGHVAAEREGVALRRPLAEVVPRRVEELCRVPRHGEGELQRLHGVRRLAGVADGEALMEEAALPDAQFDLRGEAGFGVDEREDGAVAVALHAGDLEQ